MAFQVWERYLDSTDSSSSDARTPTRPFLRQSELYKLPSSPDIQGYEVMNASHVRPLTGLLNGCVHNLTIKPEFEEETVKHWFFPKVDLCTVTSVRNNRSTIRFCSFLTLGCRNHCDLFRACNMMGS
ncbi:hypothetical protein MLD38_015377 [Melastoma candidum]|uniref:Uncharacterized protein n=1 Tax=Melastoma candidum TaxID=119954 RepID=A0ACB9RFI7_9MYRT|nr:hypothetical protein MLD38_015377 [Melastoma candidum]